MQRKCPFHWIRLQFEYECQTGTVPSAWTVGSPIGKPSTSRDQSQTGIPFPHDVWTWSPGGNLTLPTLFAQRLNGNPPGVETFCPQPDGSGMTSWDWSTECFQLAGREPEEPPVVFPARCGKQRNGKYKCSRGHKP